MKKLFALRITHRDGTTRDVTKEAYTEIDALSLVAMRAYHEPATASPIVSIALCSF